MKKEQREILSYVVIDPEAWFDHAVNTFGRPRALEMLEAKIARHEPRVLDDQRRGLRPRAERSDDVLAPPVRAGRS